MLLQVPPPLKLTAEGDILNEETGQKAQLHGINWFGWETATPSVDGLWVGRLMNTASKLCTE